MAFAGNSAEAQVEGILAALQTCKTKWTILMAFFKKHLVIR
jgi:hypothetical protein